MRIASAPRLVRLSGIKNSNRFDPARQSSLVAWKGAEKLARVERFFA